MIICHCQVVRSQDVADAVDNGASTLAQVCNITGAGTTCGGCVFTVKRLVCEHQHHGTPLTEVEGEAS